MNISEDDLRTMIRSAVSRHAGRDVPDAAIALAATSSVVHASHRMLSLVAGGDPDGRCLIEPAVACTHCGYCQSMGH